MEILLALIVGAVVGIAAHYQVGRRSTRGAAVGPIAGALAAGLVWTILTWAGVGIDTPWPWLAMIVAPALVAYPALIVLSRVRDAHDRRERARLRIG